jgi:GntR family transcriptional regulator of vanillate catabolism
VNKTADSQTHKVAEGGTAATSSQTARATLALREMLVQGVLPPGERVREVPLAAQLGVSRIPLHLALERLSHEGLLEVAGKRGFVVQRFTTDDIWDAIELRGLLEGAAARRAAERLEHRPMLAELERQAREMVALVRVPQLTLDGFRSYIDLNERFHAGLLELAGSRMLRRAIERACSLPFASPSAFLKRQYISADLHFLFQVAADQHLGLVDAVANREGMRAETLAREHARIARRNLEDALENKEGPESIRNSFVRA